jgi:hypothetical protein
MTQAVIEMCGPVSMAALTTLLPGNNSIDYLTAIKTIQAIAFRNWAAQNEINFYRTSPS